jgi:hypothetical protein
MSTAEIIAELAGLAEAPTDFDEWNEIDVASAWQTAYTAADMTPTLHMGTFGYDLAEFFPACEASNAATSSLCDYDDINADLYDGWAMGCSPYMGTASEAVAIDDYVADLSTLYTADS